MENRTTNRPALFSSLWRLMRLDRPIGIFLLLWPSLWGLWIAGTGNPNLTIVLIFIAGVVIMRTAGCIINDMIDRHIDKRVTRTRDRPLATGEIKVATAVKLTIGLLLCALGLVLTLNALTQFLAVIGLALATFYPWVKRFFPTPQLILGLAFNWGIPMAFAALTHHVPLIAWFLFFIACVWTMGYDTLYAMVDRNDDYQIGVNSTAVWLGNSVNLGVILTQLITLLGFVLLGYVLEFHIFYYWSLLATVALFAYQYYLMRQGTPEAYFRAFLNNHWVGLFLCVSLIIGG